MKKIAKELLFWLPVLHCVFALAFFLVIPNIKYVYLGAPMYWGTWDSGRCAALFMYLFTSVFSTFAAMAARYS